MKNILTKKCIVCGKEFAKPKCTNEQWRKRKLCSRICYYKWAKDNPNSGCFQKGHTGGFQKGHPCFSHNLREWRKENDVWNKGKHIKINNALEIWRKNGGVNWCKGKHIKVNNALDRYREAGNNIGEKHWNWKGGTSDLRHRLMGSKKYKDWRKNNFIRDIWTCQECKKNGANLQVHHKKAFSEILKNNNITTVQQAINCDELWDLSNGITLCIPCHRQTDTYLTRKHTK